MRVTKKQLNIIIERYLKQEFKTVNEVAGSMPGLGLGITWLTGVNPNYELYRLFFDDETPVEEKQQAKENLQKYLRFVVISAIVEYLVAGYIAATGAAVAEGTIASIYSSIKTIGVDVAADRVVTILYDAIMAGLESSTAYAGGPKDSTPVKGTTTQPASGDDIGFLDIFGKMNDVINDPEVNKSVGELINEVTELLRSINSLTLEEIIGGFLIAYAGKEVAKAIFGPAIKYLSKNTDEIVKVASGEKRAPVAKSIGEILRPWFRRSDAIWNTTKRFVLGALNAPDRLRRIPVKYFGNAGEYMDSFDELYKTKANINPTLKTRNPMSSPEYRRAENLTAYETILSMSMENIPISATVLSKPKDIIGGIIEIPNSSRFASVNFTSAGKSYNKLSVFRIDPGGKMVFEATAVDGTKKILTLENLEQINKYMSVIYEKDPKYYKTVIFAIFNDL